MASDILMTENEQKLLEAFFSCAQSYVEFGAGGSTVMAAHRVARSVMSVDSSQVWLTTIAQRCLAESTPIQPVFVHADIGAVGHLGYPPNEDRKEIWPNYHTTIWTETGAAEADLYLIDGRFRVACFLQVLLRASANSLVMIHDYIGRPHYHTVSAFADEIARSENLSVFQRKRRYDPVQIVERLKEHWVDNR